MRPRSSTGAGRAPRNRCSRTRWRCGTRPPRSSQTRPGGPRPPPLHKVAALTRSHGRLEGGHGMASGVLALGLAVLCVLGVLAFHFPQYLTTPELRRSYDVDTMRRVLYWAMVIAGGVSLVNILF